MATVKVMTMAEQSLRMIQELNAQSKLSKYREL
jgi:hypothetical protein